VISMPPARLNRTVLRVSGPDARSLLQGLLTQNLDRLAAEPTLYAGLLSPQGKVIADMFVWGAPDDDVFIDADPTRGGDLLRRLNLYKLRAAARIEDISATTAVLIHDKQFDDASADPRLPALGFRALSPRMGAPSADPAALLAHRLALGVPDLAADAAPEEVFALEALFEELDGVDFQKGCFIGQENVSRMKRRATTRKKFCPVAFDGEAPAQGAIVRADDAELGSIRAVGAGQALALLRLDRALAAARRGVALVAGETALRLAPPYWLILPDSEDGQPSDIVN
jgi:folate-binding protein YgfZ